jgi:NADH dehydrogenase
LLKAGHEVRTLTNSPNRQNVFGGKIKVFPYNFDRYDDLVRSLEGVSVFYNTYWVRFNHGSFTHEKAVENTLTLFRAAKEAGVERIVHISITNPSEDSPFEYFRGKARIERALLESGLSYGILRPAVLFGAEDILINNIAYILRHYPIFVTPGMGKYRLQPIHVDDLASLAVSQGGRRENAVIDAIGPEAFTFRALVETLDKILETRCWIMPWPAPLAIVGGNLMGKWLGDVLITREEVHALMAGLLFTGARPTGETALSVWARHNAANLGRRYHCELARRSDREMAYAGL